MSKNSIKSNQLDVHEINFNHLYITTKVILLETQNF